jgi:hypothetical protein
VRLTNHMLPIPNSTDAKEPRSFEVQYHVRGRRKRQPLTGRCQTVQDIIELGQQSFSAFADRNPWICIDSKHGTVFVGLDPERQIFQPERNPGLQRNDSADQESIQQ